MTRTSKKVSWALCWLLSMPALSWAAPPRRVAYLTVTAAPAAASDPEVKARAEAWSAKLCAALTARKDLEVVCATDLDAHFLTSANGRTVVSAEAGFSVQTMQARLDRVSLVVLGELAREGAAPALRFAIGPHQPVFETDGFAPRPVTVTVEEAALPPSAPRLAKLAGRVAAACATVRLPSTSVLEGPR